MNGKLWQYEAVRGKLGNSWIVVDGDGKAVDGPFSTAKAAWTRAENLNHRTI